MATISDSVSELRDREARKNNLVIFNIPESSNDDAPKTENCMIYQQLLNCLILSWIYRPQLPIQYDSVKSSRMPDIHSRCVSQ